MYDSASTENSFVDAMMEGNEPEYQDMLGLEVEYHHHYQRNIALCR
jgi:hypothetical protein